MWPWIAALVSWQAVVSLQNRADSRSRFDAAEAYAKEQGKPLLIVGGPYGSTLNNALHVPAHGTGDVCVDICPENCAGAPVVEVADVRTMPFRAKQFGAAYAGHILEHLPTTADAEAALRELQRVADVVFVASPTKLSLWSWVLPEHHLWVNEAPDGRLEFEQR